MHAPRPSLPTTHEIKSSNEYHVERKWLATLLTKKKTTGYAQQSLIRVLPNGAMQNSRGGGTVQLHR
jgi:hypothetical protein